jgi:hypothetical protein
MSTQAQVTANQANAQHSTGPKTAEGKSASSQNNLRHGFTGQFRLLASEDPRAYEHLRHHFQAEHKPTTFTEEILVEKMAQHHWLSQRALELQNITIETTGRKEKDVERSLSLYIRYQTTHERAFHKCLNDLLKLRSERRKEQIGFESQARRKEEHARKQSNETRKQDLHKLNVWLAEVKAEHQELLNHNLETPETRMPNRVQRILARQQAA